MVYYQIKQVPFIFNERIFTMVIIGILLTIGGISLCVSGFAVGNGGWIIDLPIGMLLIYGGGKILFKKFMDTGD